MKRYVGVVAPVSTDSLALAMLEDVVDLVAAMEQVDGCLVIPADVVAAGAVEAVRSVTWPGMPVVEVAGRTVAEALAGLAAAGADEAAVVVPDVPDLPALLLGKLHSALTTAAVAVCPASDGRLVAFAAGLPLADWAVASAISLDDADGLDRLRAAAPPRRGLHVGAGWHRVGSFDDARHLDPRLEGWEATRAVLGV